MGWGRLLRKAIGAAAVLGLLGAALWSSFALVPHPHVTGEQGLLTAASWGSRSAAERAADEAWLARGQVPRAAGTDGGRWEPMVRQALLDLRHLTARDGAVAAGAAAQWSYAWPRDTAFAAVALERAGHHDDARRALDAVASRVAHDRVFQARYRLDGPGVPDDRPAQLDGAGWLLWAVTEVVPPEELRRSPVLRGLAETAASRLLTATREGNALPAPSPDYWEVEVSRVTLGTTAPVLLGLRSCARPALEGVRAGLPRRCAAAARTFAARVAEHGGSRVQRFGRSGGLEAGTAMLMPPLGEPTAAQVRAFRDYQREARQPAGGLAPGVRWVHEGVSWTPETALAAYASAGLGDRAAAAAWLDWLAAHRAPWGSLPEKVSPDGDPMGPAPLAWTAALVVLTVELLSTP